MKKVWYNEVSVSEILGIVLLLSIAIVAMAGLYVSVLSEDGPTENTFVRINGRVEGTNIVLEHQGGESIPEESWVTISLPDGDVSGPISDFLTDLNNDGKWNIGEKLLKNFTYDLDKLDEYTVAEVLSTDDTSNSIQFMGPVKFEPVSDAGLDISIDDLNGPPIRINDQIQITIKVTSYGGDVDGSGGVKVSYFIPEGLLYQNSNSPSGHGSYDNTTGLWEVGNVLVGEPALLKINAIVLGIEKRDFVQLAMILDGSGSISSDDWNLMTQGLSDSIIDEEIFPHDGSVELTVVQFGVNTNECDVEIEPTIVNSSNYIDIANNISSLIQGNGGTAMAAGIYLASDTIENSENFDIAKRQVFNLVTDGKPTYWSNVGEYIGNGDGVYTHQEDLDTTEEAVDHLINDLGLTEEKDELDSLAVGSGPDVPWLNESIIWPEPGIIWDITTSDPPEETGWVATIDSFEDFELAIDQMFRVIFSGIKNTVTFVESVTYDPNNNNNHAEITITPED